MADGHVSPEHRARSRSLALEPKGELERLKRQGLLHRLIRSCRANSIFLWILFAPPRLYPKRWDGKRWLLAPDRWRRKQLLEKQSISGAALHRRGGFAACAMGRS